MSNHLVVDQIRAIGHPERFLLLQHLLHSDCSISELSEITGLESSIISNHLLKMRKLGIVDYTRFHRILQYRIVSKMVVGVLKSIQQTSA